MKKLLLMVLFLYTLAGCGAAERGGNTIPPPMSETKRGAGQVTVNFDYAAQPGSASNQFAVWIEDAAGKLVKTLYATKFTANGGYKNRPDSILNWVAKSGLADMSKMQVDAITGATPKSGKLSYVWDLTGNDGNAVPDGSYTAIIEGTMRWKNYVLFSGSIDVGGGQASIAVEPVFHFEADGGNVALAEDSAETNMITNVIAEYVPESSAQ
jgi:hypothetical protein